MGYTEETLNDVRSQIDAHSEPLAEARKRLALVRAKAIAFRGALRTYASGSLAQHTFIHPIGDGDGGVVLNRSFYPNLGPDGSGEAPQTVADEMCALLSPAVREVYPEARCSTSKRGPKLYFGQPVDGQDPTVDMVIALTRKYGEGLWIPNLHTNKWEASHPELHVELFTSGSESLRRTRRRVIRLLKAWNKQYNQPAFSSHNLSVWAWEFVESGMGMAVALGTVLAKAASRVESGAATIDPAKVSNNVRLLISRETAARRLRKAANGLTDALEHDDDLNAVLSALSGVYWNYLTDPSPNSLASKAAILRKPQPISTTTLGLGGMASLVTPTRAYGDPKSPW
ncbi:hypothetical protein [Streptosporangium saharense]|uniref:hypothetical protein n=1 Tax=Streptosporangium saharense TaxID=1706840 RepID=UPI00341FFEB9